MARIARSPARRAAARPPEPDLRSIFRRRTEALIERLADQASDETIAAALEAPSDVGGLARLLSDMAPLGIELQSVDPLAEAIARGAEAKQELLRDAGGGWSSTRVAAHLKMTRQGVDKRRRAGKLLALQSGHGDYLYPVCQFTDDGVIAGIDRFLAACPPSGGWTRLDVLLTPAEEIGGISPLDALRRGDAEAAVLVASMFGEQGGPADADE
ncbi:hypothetical protein [Longimicrobium sp.]|uniref:hypothetical protein n=1 Tax=Longimicrobium sp. TaxID=2029185 RepID=UPI002C7501F6|nr:hypothetical protein [Longimicrobium sp.]HSU13461.1 hypothetical protein [Longimicrobium sp.]